MKALLRIARTEVLEHRRQPWMVMILAANYALWIGVFGAAFFLLEGLGPEARKAMQQQLLAAGVEFDAALRLATSSLGSVLFTNLPLFVALLSGTSVLHDRERGTLPFLMLAPITRLQLVTGKLLGAMAIPLVLHFVLVGAGCLLLSRFELLSPFSAKLGGSSAWWVAYLVGAPASAAFVGALGTIISARSNDIRSSMQFTSFFIGLLSLGMGAMLVDGISAGATAQVGYALACLVAAVITLAVGARLISTDVA